MEEHILRIIILGIISWATAFQLLRMFLPKRSFEFCNRLVSTVHATLAFTLASLSVEDWTCPVCPPASKPSPSQMQALAISLSYLIYDLICCQFDKRVTIDNTIHHLVSIVGIGAGLVYGKCGSELIAALCITELSSPFLHLRELLKELGHGGTDLSLVADVSYSINLVLNSAVADLIRSCILVCKNGFWALPDLGDSYCQQSSRYQGNGSGIAAGQCLLVL
uniref:TLC domain-containing protein n=1 Tax=Salix viminalis TaxID=40686 RepID=A0A6N2LFE3_SALVM